MGHQGALACGSASSKTPLFTLFRKRIQEWAPWLGGVARWAADTFPLAVAPPPSSGRAGMPQIDRDESKAKINKLIADERKELTELEKKIKEKEDAGNKSVVHDIKRRDREKQKISGKQKILEYIGDAKTVDDIDGSVEKDRKRLKDLQDEVKELRGQVPKPQDKIDQKDKEIEELKGYLEGEDEAKGSIVTY
jgi:hypothetical protein